MITDWLYKCVEYIYNHEKAFWWIGMFFSASIVLIIAYQNYSPDWTTWEIVLIGAILLLLLPLFGRLSVMLFMAPFSILGALLSLMERPKVIIRALVIIIVAVLLVWLFTYIHKGYDGSYYNGANDSEHYEPQL